MPENFRRVRTAEGDVLRLAKADLPSGDGLVRRYATVVVAAADSLHPEDADVACTGVDDDLTIREIIQAQWDEGAFDYVGPTPHIVLMEGTYLFDGGLVIDRGGVAVEGQGEGTVIRCINHASPAISINASAVSLTKLTFLDDMAASRASEELLFGGSFIDGYDDTVVSHCTFACDSMESVITGRFRARITNNVVCGIASGLWQAGAMRPTSLSNTLARGDDNSSAADVLLPFSVNFYGTTYTTAYVNNNGNITFGYDLEDYTPELLSSISTPIIASFWADVDTRPSASGRVTYGNTTVDGRTAFCVNWNLVGYYYRNVDKLNTFQMFLIDRSDTGSENFDIEFNYGQIEWETGDASDGVDGLGGYSARIGFADGSGTAFEVVGGDLPGSFLNQRGRLVFQFRNGNAQSVDNANLSVNHYNAGGTSNVIHVNDHSLVSGNKIHVYVPPSAEEFEAISLVGNAIVFSENHVKALFVPGIADLELFEDNLLNLTTVRASGNAITITGNYLYGWFDTDDGWVSLENTTVVYAREGNGGLISGNVCDGDVSAGNSYYDTIVLGEDTDGWQVTSNNLWPEWDNGSGVVVDDGYNNLVELNHPNS